MKEYLKQPIVQKHFTAINGDGFKAVGAEMQGWRKNHQDAHLIEQITPEVHLFAVFDGHGGYEVSEFIKEMFPKELRIQPYLKLKHYGKALESTFKRMQNLLRSERGEQRLKAIRLAKENRKCPEKVSIAKECGCTANVMLLTPKKIYVANIGDSRSVLCREGKAIALSYDHKPTLGQQRSRIVKAGGYVKNGRVDGVLNLSRAFGDLGLKSNWELKPNKQKIISEPDIIQIDRQEGDQFALIGCDGVWEKYGGKLQPNIDQLKLLLSKETAVNAIQSFLNHRLGTSIDSGNGLDNMTIILINFK